MLRQRLDCSLTPTQVLGLLRHDAHPFALIGRWAGGLAVVGSEPTRVAVGPDECMAALAGTRTGRAERADSPPAPSGFGGGWVGYLGYQLGQSFERLPPPPGPPPTLPSAWLGFYDHVLAFDGEAWHFEALWTDERDEHLRSRLAELTHRLATGAARPEPCRPEPYRPEPYRPEPYRPEPYRLAPLAIVPSPAAHQRAVARTLDYIGAGDVYQANICLRLEGRIDGDPLDLFCRGVDALRPDYAAFLRFDGGAAASFSPELFLRQRGDTLSSSPIKGTAARVGGVDEGARDGLAASGKNRAENIMIVDLMRNDFGRVCVPGSVHAPEVARTEPHPGVWHLVSDVTGTVAPGVDTAEVIRATFPPGSVTGAPKVRAMEVISELEATPRELYTGAIGYVSPVAGVEFNVVIRTFEFADDRVWLGVGGGIVSESDPAAEFEECLVKARPLLAAVGAEIDFGRDYGSMLP